MKEFKDKVLVVTGGSRGIGKAIAVEGAKRGMKIVLNDIDGDQLAKTCEEIKGMGVECIGQHADISLYENIPLLGSFHLPFANIIASLTTIVNIAATL